MGSGDDYAHMGLRLSVQEQSQDTVALSLKRDGGSCSNSLWGPDHVVNFWRGLVSVWLWLPVTGAP